MTPEGRASTDPGADWATSHGVPSQGMPKQGGNPETPGPLLASGLSADIYAVSEQQVLRRYRSGQDASREVEIMRHVAAHGFPVPQVEHLGGPDLLMTRLHGPTMLQALAAGEIGLADGAHILADMHEMLHEIPAPAGDGVVVHLDLHPGNVVLEGTGPVLIDWANARGGPGGLDEAMTALIIAEVAVDAGGDYSEAARSMLASFLSVVHENPVPHLDAAAEIRAADPALVAGERDLIPPARDLVRRFVEVAWIG